MRIVLINPYYSEGMGYLENCLPKALASLKHEVFVITSTGQVYFNQSFYKSSYEKFLGAPVVDPVRKEIDGYILQRLPFRLILGKVILKGLGKVLIEIKPDIVQTFDPFSFLNIQVLLRRPFMHYRVFTANHIMQSVFPLAKAGGNSMILRKALFYLTRTLPGMLINRYIEKSFPITVDAQNISEKYYSIPRHKMRIIPLGVDTQLFTPPWSDELKVKRIKKREKYSIDEDEILCIYTGRFSKGKNPLCLAKAINVLRNAGEKYKAIFIGDGSQSEEIRNIKGCITIPFVKFNLLADYYMMADIGVWPREESTSMLDAASCGLPLVISDTVQATERILGIGLTYNENNVDDLSTTLLKLKDSEIRQKLGKKGAERMINEFSWIKIAGIRLEEYNLALAKE